MKSKQNKIGIIGLGYVGLPLAIVFAEEDFNVIGFDISSIVCNNLNKGISHIKDIENNTLLNVVHNNKFEATTDFNRLAECDVIYICVPTPLNKIKDPDLSYVVIAAEAIGKVLRKGQLIILESTTYPGTTREVVLPILENSGLNVGIDFFLCFSPERVDPGNSTWNTKNIPKVIGGITEACLMNGVGMYKKVFEVIIPVKNTESAELVKVYENTFRMINIALANELSLICDRLDIDVWDVIEAAATKPFGFMKFTPGPGLGGHCIPLDPHYLAWKMRSLSFKTRMIDLASEINSSMPEVIVEKIGKNLNTQGKAFKRSTILIMGIAYKKDIDDLRESPAIDIIKILQDKEANVVYHDPYCPIIKDDGHTLLKNLPLNSIELSDQTIASADVIVVVTDHSCINYKHIYSINNRIVDTRGIFRKIS